MSIYGKGDKGKVDRLFSELIRSIGYCENCYRTPPTVQLQCAHIISRRYSNTRARLENAFSLCAGCHRWYTDYPVEFASFIQRSWAADYYDNMYKTSRLTGAKMDWAEVQRHLLQVKQNLNGGSHTLDQLRGNEAAHYNQ